MANPKKIILDTDIGFDCDDAGALALLHRLCDLKEAELLAVTACYDSPYAAGCIDAIDRYYNRPVPIGVLYGVQKAVDDAPVYSPALCREFYNAYPAENYPQAESAVPLLRKLLASADEKSVTFVVIGSLATAAALLQSQPDIYSPLPGAALIEKKLERTVVMGGRFFEYWPEDILLDSDFSVTWEWNIKADVPAAQLVCSNWPTELIFSSYEIGLPCISMTQYCEIAPEKDPVRRAYMLHGSTHGRQSWDHTAVLEAVRPGRYFRQQPWGRITVTDDGITQYRQDRAGKHSFLIPMCSNDQIIKAIDDLVVAP